MPTSSSLLTGLVVKITGVTNGTAGNAPTVAFSRAFHPGFVLLHHGGPDQRLRIHDFGTNTSTPGYVTESATGACTYTFKNIVPAKATGTYPNNLGHNDFPGCFRCHDENHATSDKKTITQDCTTCHQSPAVEETKTDVLKTLGLAEILTKAQKQ